MTGRSSLGKMSTAIRLTGRSMPNFVKKASTDWGRAARKQASATPTRVTTTVIGRRNAKIMGFIAALARHFFQTARCFQPDSTDYYRHSRREIKIAPRDV